MTLTMYALKDELNGFTTPIPFMNEELAKRYLKDQYMSNPTVKNTPEDFSLWKVGEFDSETGAYTQTRIDLVERAKNYGE